jgi:hypothetical protein
MEEAMGGTAASQNVYIEDRAADQPGFARLRRLLGHTAPFQDERVRRRAGRALHQALNSQAFERAMLNPTVSAVSRLRRLTQLQQLARESDLAPRDREEAIIDLDRGGMRVLWGERIIATVIESEAPPERRAAALLKLIAQGVLPTGACAKAALEPAKSLLLTTEAHAALAGAPALRDQILALLAAAEAKRAAPLDARDAEQQGPPAAA